MRAAILAVGSELLGSRRLDTNSLFLTATLRRFGVDTAFKAVIGDHEGEIAAEVGRLVRRFDLLLVTGGLGPTADDLTREAVAAALDRGLSRRDELVDELRRRFASFGIEMPEVNKKQADVVDGAEVLPNPRGTAPGLRIDATGEMATVFLFPGVPDETRGLVADHLEPWLVEHAGEATTETRVLKIACLPESRVEADLEPFYTEFGRDGFSVLPSPGEVTLELTATGTPEAREEWFLERSGSLRRLFSSALFTDRAEVSLETAVGEALLAAGATVATAESCTGGLIGERLTRVAGSSAYYLGGVVSYADEVKTEVLGVSAATLAGAGAVSEAVVVEMAVGARRLLGADHAIAVSGIAGPGGGTKEKAVGTVHLAVAGGRGVRHRRLLLPGDRERIRWLASQWALDLLRRRLPAERA